MQAVQLNQQPHIPTIVQAMNTLRDQSQRLANMPGVVDGQAIAAAIQQQTQQLAQQITQQITQQVTHQVQAQLQQLTQQITQQIAQQFQRQFQRIESRRVTPPFCPLDCCFGLFSTNLTKNRMINFETAAVNARIFTANSSATLLPLEAINTGNPIPNFPQTITDLHALTCINFLATPLPQRLP